jgi:hypothetical protein
VILTNETNAQQQPMKRDSLFSSSDSSLSNFQVQQLKFARFLRMKYYVVDSLSRAGLLYQQSFLQFYLHGPNFMLLDPHLPKHTELVQPFWMKDHLLRASGGYQQLRFNIASIMELIHGKQEWEKSKHQFNKHIPSNLQLDVLNVLWKQKTSTQLEIYAGIDSTYVITAQKLDQQLERMVNLGLVERKIISPQHIFTIITPFKSFQIEGSSLNRKNRVYLYRSRLEKNQIIQLLLSRLYRVKQKDVGHPSEINRLNEKLKIILSDEQE